MSGSDAGSHRGGAPDAACTAGAQSTWSDPRIRGGDTESGRRRASPLAVRPLADAPLARDNAGLACLTPTFHGRGCSTVAASATCWIDSSRECARVRARCWCSAARRESARPPCCEYLSAAAEGCRIARAAGVESEMELAFAGLHALCAPMLGRLGHLPSPQRDALSTAFGLSAGPAAGSLPGRLGRAEPAGRRRPRSSRSSASSTTRSGSTGCPCRRSRSWRDGCWRSGWDWCSRVRESGDEHELDGLPELVIEGLAADDARRLLDATIPGPLDAARCGTGSSARPAATRSRCSSCRAGGSRSRSRADSGCPWRCR